MNCIKQLDIRLKKDYFYPGELIEGKLVVDVVQPFNLNGTITVECAVLPNNSSIPYHRAWDYLFTLLRSDSIVGARQSSLRVEGFRFGSAEDHQGRPVLH